MKLKMTVDNEDQLQAKTVELLKTRFENPGQLEELETWTRASEIEQARWSRAGEAVEARVSGGMYDLVEELISDRAFEHQAGIYFNPAADQDNMVYAARRLTQAGQKVVLLDWDVARSQLEEVLSSEITVIDISQASSRAGNLVDLPGGRAELVVDQGAGDQEWIATVDLAGKLMSELEGVDVVVFLVGGGSALEGDASSQVQVSMDTLAMSATRIGELAANWGASILVGGGDPTVSSPELWSKLLTVLVSMQELS